ncbi:beta-glucosidase [Mycolicibacterium fallax]|uniref:beta-N-acetylhexosaminidase n=2 Tax=Mycolicibacterium fallax TaxID=1793 RepID=A0A1X1R8Z6_MYCFA|nr:glycoside hydrolase family 3 N-terminal domain-containing protein [Mycolicibacterium fallax]ORV01603.1 beta-glucosidase [Mycolicibacterium fallax]BBY98992.1 glycosyl hydrolase [Mycolicibacterium fallax]
MSTSPKKGNAARVATRPRTIILSFLAVVAMVAAVVIGLQVRAGSDGGVGVAHAAPPVTPAARTLAPAPKAPVCGTLSLRDQLAQLLMVGVRNAADARAVVTEHHVGGIFIGSWTDLSMLGGPLAEVKAAAGAIPLAVSVDEEGGRVSRLKSVIGAQPSPRELAANNTPEQVRAIAAERARKMSGLGITIDFAPVLDVTAGDADGAIGDRSFSGDPNVVTEYAGAYAAGLRDGGLLPVYKHFPGHGRASGDSHTGGVTTPPLADLETSDLVPYRALIGAGPAAVMVGHMAVPGLTGGQQSSLSPAAYGLLRQMGFGGAVFTDDLSSMQAISDVYPVPEAVLKALAAGADVALWVTTAEVPAVLDRLEAAVNSGELPQARVDEALRRAVAMKGGALPC